MVCSAVKELPVIEQFFLDGKLFKDVSRGQWY